MTKKLIRLTEDDIHRIVKESVKRVLVTEGLFDRMFGKSKNMPESTIEKENKPQDHIYTEKEMQWLYDNQDKLDRFQEKVLNAGMWVRAMHANYHGYAKRWPNISVENGEIFYYGNNGELKRVPFNKDM